MNPDTSEPSAERQALDEAFTAACKQWKNVVTTGEVSKESAPFYFTLFKAGYEAGQARAGAKESQPVAHIMPSVLRKLQSSEANGHVYSLPFRSQDEQSVPLYTHSRAEAPVGPNIFSTVNCASAQLGNPVCWIPCGRDECKPAQEKSVQPADERRAFERANLRDHFGQVPTYRERELMFVAWCAARAAIAPNKGGDGN